MVVALTQPELPAGCAFLSPEYKDIMSRLQKHANGPKPANWAETIPWEMALVHSFMLNMFERMYAFAEHAVEHNDLDNYLGFADVALGHLHNHHHFEEEVMFPAVEKACNDPTHRLTRNVEQHAVFASELTAAWLYVRECRAALSPKPKVSPVPAPSEDDLKIDPAAWGLDPKLGFQPAAFRREMDKWLIPLTEHLDEEIETLQPEWIAKMGEKEFMRQRKVVEKYLQGYDPTWFLCSTLASMPRDVADKLLPLPMPVRKILLPLLWAGKYSGYWKYCSHPENLNFW